MRRTELPLTPEGPEMPVLARRRLWSGFSGQLTAAGWQRGQHPEDRVAEVEQAALVLLFEGSYVRHVGSRAAVGDPMHVTLYETGERHRVRHPRGDTTRGIRFRPSSELLVRVAVECGATLHDAERRPFPALSVPVDSRMAVALRILAGDLARGPAPDPLLVDEVLASFASRVLSALHGRRPPRGTAVSVALRGRLRELQNRLWSEPRRRERLEDLAAETGCSVWHLSKAFIEITGTTMSTFVKTARLHRAVSRILDGDDDLTDVALASGYASHSHLSESFRREIGLSPSALRGATGDAALSRIAATLRPPP
ncbi:MAG TPA: AraC family transcriptional regulator [bacterium]|nr:AraC family transcriptional regulator [bacterium]